ncbi:Dual specificity protein phosphatase 22-A [Acipenser ruthenus]|uniref:Dual specificity protein phosphatase 22-A n=1 Tax=Acipenser ruthenus TaxID=7906 RepID=A0A444U7I0_ACIRT|nr:Dual specificity protein phosphatase 22-A [Acipenser ruthenus]
MPGWSFPQFHSGCGLPHDSDILQLGRVPSAVKAVRAFMGSNFGFQQQLQEFQMTLLSEFRRWLRMKYSNNPFNDQEAVCKMLRQYEEQEQQQSWTNHTTTIYPLPYNTYGSANSSWVSRSEP